MLTFCKNYSPQVLKANMKIVGATEYALVLYRGKLPKFNNVGEDGKSHMVKTASPKPQQTDNEKYAMRCWMLRLGFIGDEFKTAREILLRNMEGNASWRNA